MSWSISIAGTPEEVVSKLQAQADNYTDPNTKKEYEAVLPHLIGLIQRNDLPKISISGSGHSGWQDGEVKNSYCMVTITQGS